MVKRACKTARWMDEEADKLKNTASILNRGAQELFELSKIYGELLDKQLLREFNQANRKASESDRVFHRPILRGKDNQNVLLIREHLKMYRDFCSVDTLAKANAWVMGLFDHTGDFQFVLDFLDTGEVISVTGDERTQIIHRFENEGQPPINQFAPYAAKTITLFYVMLLFLIENNRNSTPHEVLRDYEYLYYVLDNNITFVSADKRHKEFIEGIPILEPVLDRFTFIDMKDPEARKKWLKSIGISE